MFKPSASQPSLIRFGLAALLIAPALIACGRPVTSTDVRFAGVGLNPDEIGPSPELAGGYIEYDWVNFAGGGLSLASLGLVSFDEVGPNLAGFKPPYAAVYGLGFMFDELVPAPGAQFGNFGVPPEVDDACWTNLEPASALSANLTEVGSAFTIASADGATKFSLGRYPEIYPPDPQDIFVYYIGVEAWHPTALESYVPDSEGTLTRQVISPINFTHGAEVNFSFPGGLPPVEAPVASIPRPSASVPNDNFYLPTRASNLSVSWSGQAWENSGAAGDVGSFTSCVSFAAAPITQAEYDALSEADRAALCATDAEPPADSLSYLGQIYTGPWDTDDGTVTFRWNPIDEDAWTGSSPPNEVVSLTVRFLGPVDHTDESFLVARVPLEATESAQESWADAQDDELIPADESLPQGYRSPLACDEDVDWIFDQSLVSSDGSTGRALQGDPTFNLAEVNCRLADDGEFVLTQEQLASAIAYAKRKGAEGALFYFSRSTETHVDVPAVKDSAGMKSEISPVIIRSNSTEIGRFWLDGELDAVQE